VSLTVTVPAPDYALTISNPTQSATVNQNATFSGTLKALRGYGSAVNLTCGVGAPPTCTISPASLTPTVAGTPFTVTVQSGLAQTYSFNINGTGTDAAHVPHIAPVVFSSLFTFTISDSSGSQSVKAGQSASYSLVVTPEGSNVFPGAVSFACTAWSPQVPPGVACSNPAITAGGSGAQTVTLTISTSGPNSAFIRPIGENRRSGSLFFVWISMAGMVIGGLARKPSARKATGVALALIAVSAMMLSSCGGGSNSGGVSGVGGAGVGAVTVNVSPPTASKFPTQQQKFTAAVGGTTNTQVTWQVNGVTGGSVSVGTVDGTGLYTAPAAVPTPDTVTVAAVSQADVTKSGSAMVNILSPTPSGTYTVSIAATVGNVTKTTTATLMVQ
jgi:hypothetical protein